MTKFESMETNVGLNGHSPGGKLGMKKRRAALARALNTDPDDSWAMVELYRWEHGHLPGEAGTTEKPLNVANAMRQLAEALLTRNEKNFPSPFNVSEVLKFAANLLDKNKAATDGGIVFEDQTQSVTCDKCGLFLKQSWPTYPALPTGPAFCECETKTAQNGTVDAKSETIQHGKGTQP